MKKTDAEKWVSRVRNCNRQKDLLHLLLSYPMELEASEVYLSLLRDKLIKLSRMIKRPKAVLNDNETHDTKIDMLAVPDVLYDVEMFLSRYSSCLRLCYANPRRTIASIPVFPIIPAKGFGLSSRAHVPPELLIDSAIHLILRTLRQQKLKVIGICGRDASIVMQTLENLPEIRSMFEVVISISVSKHHSIREVQSDIAIQLHRLVGTDIALSLNESLKGYKFILFLHGRSKNIDLYDLEIPMWGTVVLTAKDVYKVMPVDLAVNMEDLLLPWQLFWNNVGIPIASDKVPIALQIIEACQNHLLAIILVARALAAVADVEVWKLALQGIKSSSNLSFLGKGMSEVLVSVLGFIWEQASVITRYSIKRCIPKTKERTLSISSLLCDWVETGFVKTEEEGKSVLQGLLDAFLLEKISNARVQMREEISYVLLVQFIPHLPPLWDDQEAPENVEWYAAKVYIGSNLLSELPEKPNCPCLVKLLLQNNCDLMVIPSSFFECMPKLEVLDLSYTSIKHLPASISKLISLRELFVRGCELLMELPSEIGRLSNLEVLDLGGTLLMFLPEEILRLRQLECLKFSLYGYGNSYRESKQISKRIPSGLLAGLYMLKTVSIDVDQDDEEWVADVQDVLCELLKLRRLTELKLYLPEVGLLKEIICVRNFKFTVGHHKQRIVSCLPHAVEQRFEMQENYLKYVNGKGIPTEIQNALKYSCGFYLNRHWTAKNLSDFGTENMVELKFCLLVECNELLRIVDGREFCAEEKDECELGFDKEPILESLEYLGIYCLINLRSIWEGAIGNGSLSKLKFLTLQDCPNLSTIFTPSLLGSLCNLEELEVEDCPKITSLVSQQSVCSGSNQFLPSLKKISLLDLPELVNISNGLCIAPKLESIIVYACPMLESLSPIELSCAHLKVIKGETEWWDSLKWHEYERTSRLPFNMARIFVKLERDATLMDQLT